MFVFLQKGLSEKPSLRGPLCTRHTGIYFLWVERPATHRPATHDTATGTRTGIERAAIPTSTTLLPADSQAKRWIERPAIPFLSTWQATDKVNMRRMGTLAGGAISHSPSAFSSRVRHIGAETITTRKE